MIAAAVGKLDPGQAIFLAAPGTNFFCRTNIV